MLPWWFIFVAYGLSLICIALSTLFIIARGIEFGEEKTHKWVVSIVSGFFSSILLMEPVKILVLAILFAFVYGNANDDKEANEFLDDIQLDLRPDEEYLHALEVSLMIEGNGDGSGVCCRSDLSSSLARSLAPTV